MSLTARAIAMKHALAAAVSYPLFPAAARELLAELAQLVTDMAADLDRLNGRG